MIDIKSHPIWKGNQVWGDISPVKKKGHLIRIFLAKQYAKLWPRSIFIGITGSVGKTTASVASNLILSQKFKTISTQVDLDPILNIPITIFKVRPSIKKVILEMGIEYLGEMEFYLSIVKPYTAIVTRISYQHSEFLGNPESISNEKGKLVEQLPQDGFAILNYDDPLVRGLAQKTKARVIFYGLNSKNCHVWAGNIHIKDFSTIFELNYGVERVEVRSKLLGFHQVTPMLAAAALGISMDIPLIKIQKALEQVESPQHRLQPHLGYNNSVILDDTHNAAPIAVEEAIETLKHVSARRRIVVLGEMRELGEYSEKMHRLIAQKLYTDKVDLVLLGGGETKYINDELLKLGFLSERLYYNLSNPQIVNKLLKIISKGDVVLVKGARTVRLDEVVDRIIKNKR